MKNLKKIFAIAMSVATVAMSTSAFAATYDAEATSVALTETEIAEVMTDAAGQMTVVVVPKTFGETSTAADIYYINQDDVAAFEAIIADMGVKAELDGEKEWQVRIGGENVAEVITFDVEFEEEGPVYTLGDVNADTAINLLDANDIVKYVLQEITFTDVQMLAANTNGDDTVNLLDANQIVKYVLQDISSFQ